MQRGIVIAIGLALIAAPAGASPRVIGPDDRPLSDATVTADADAFWVRDGAGLPLLIHPDAENHLRFPGLPIARLLVLDAATGAPLKDGQIRWVDPTIPDNVSTVPWSTPNGRLDIGCRGGESVEIAATGYRERRLSVEPGNRRHTLLLEPAGDLTIRLQPAAAATLWLADTASISLLSPFGSAAVKHEIGEDGAIVVKDLDTHAKLVGIVVSPGKTPIVGRIAGVPRTVTLPLQDGLALHGRVVNPAGAAIAGARVVATGRLEELGGHRYRQEARTDQDGFFSVGGLLPGELELKACASTFACSVETAELSGDSPTDHVAFRLEPGHDFRLALRDTFDRPVVDADVIDTERFRRLETDRDGVIVIEGVKPGDELSLRISGGGLKIWQGRIDMSESERVLRLPSGGVIEWPIITARIFDPDEVVATWSRLNARGRELADGGASWDPRHQLVRADGLDAGPHRLTVRLPGSASLVSETIEIAVGEEAVLPAAVPDRGMALGGRVLDAATFEPVAGARITCEPGSPHEFRKPQRLEGLQSALSDAEGVFLLEGLDAGRCRAVVRAPGFAPWRRDGVVPDDAGADLGDIELDQGMTIVGQVVDRADRPQIGVTVDITETAAYAYLADATVRTDHDGWFRAEALPVGRWTVTASRGGANARTTVEGTGGDTIRTRLRLGGIRLEGEVWLGDRPAGGGHLVLSTEGSRGDGVVVMIRTDAEQRRFFGVDRAPVTIAVGGDGRFVSDGILPGVYTASYTHPGPGGAPISRELVIPETEIHRCLIRYSDAGLDGIVVDPDGRPVAGAAVYVLTGDGGAAASGFTDGDGVFSFTGLDEATVRVTAIHTEFAEPEGVTVDLRSGDRAGPVTIELAPHDGAELSLQVSSAVGSLGGAPVYLVGADTRTGFTDDVGAASFSGLEPGRYRPCAAAYGGAAGCGPEVSLDRGDRRELALELGGGGFVEVLLGPMERAPTLRVLTADGIDITSMLMMVSPPIPGPDGVRIGPLKADDYRITVSMAEGLRQGSATAAEGEQTVLDLR